jgi:hypothetical protein
MAFRAPLLGYNTNVRHKGRLYHIQTEDSGVGHPHIITHLFADGGRIVGSKKTSYAEQLSAENLQDTVKKLMQAQHKAMFIALRDGHFDESGPSELPNEQTGTIPVAVADMATATASAAAGAGKAGGSKKEPASEPARPAPLYQGTLSAAPSIAPSPLTANPSRQSIFGSDLTSEKSLDEVILSYLATDDKDA